MALKEWLGGNDAALRDAEYCLWLQTFVLRPPVFRFDAFLRVKTSNPTLCDVFSGELTELGACTLGWDLPDMVSHLFPAVLGSFLEDAPCKGSALTGACLCHQPRLAGTLDRRCDVSAFVSDLKRRQAAHQSWEAQREGGEAGEEGRAAGGAEETEESEAGQTGAAATAGGAAAKKKKRKKSKKQAAKE
jgi:hypothetical protein